MRQLLRTFGGVEQGLRVQDVFATSLYTGNGGSQTITNGVNLAEHGGLVWQKSRSRAVNHCLTDTVRGANNQLSSSTSGEQSSPGNVISSFNANGVTILGNSSTNLAGDTCAAWTFRKAARFFDIVTWTGNGASGRQIAHSLGVKPGMIVVKRTNAAGNSWAVHHRSIHPNTLRLELTDAQTTEQKFTSSAPTASVFYVGSDSDVNAPGASYVAYLFAHDTASDGVVQCGSYTGNGSASGPTVTLGWEPQYVLIKAAGGATGGWHIFDSSRGDGFLLANSAAAENTAGDYIDFTSTGFNIKTSNLLVNSNYATMIYLAIRKGPM